MLCGMWEREISTSTSALLAGAFWAIDQALLKNAGTDRAARTAEVVSRYQENGYLNGAVLVADEGQVTYAHRIGMANIAANTPNTTKTRFRIVSITKQFTAVLVLPQVADGRLALDGKEPFAECSVGQRSADPVVSSAEK